MNNIQLGSIGILEEHQIEDLLSSMVEMIKQREQIALETSLGRTMSRLTHAKSLIYYRLTTSTKGTFAVPVLQFTNGEATPQEDTTFKSIKLSTNPELVEQLSKTKVEDMFHNTGKRWADVILPLRGPNEHLSGFCHITHSHNNINTKQVIAQVLEFYQQFQTLLDDNERDNLTGLLNRKTLAPQIANVIRTLQNRHRRTADKSEAHYCLAMMDIDHFKRINDTYGHIYGDEVLLNFANLMRGSFRENDHMFRYGGEEFMVLLNNIDTERAQMVLNRFRTKVEGFKFPQNRHITVSAGVALIRENDLPQQAINRADQALYYAKQNGRNQIRAYEDLLKEGILKEPDIQTGKIELF